MALKDLLYKEEAQLINDLMANGLSISLLVNFGAKDKLEWKRIDWTN
jgi:hypothetical protein